MTGGARLSDAGMTVWKAYTDLHAYVTRVDRRSPGSVQGTVPARLPRRPRRAEREAAESIAATIAVIRQEKGCPPVDDDMVAWYFLWSQLLRCSYPLRPSQAGVGEWFNLAWYPLRVLGGRSQDVALLVAWRRWLFDNGCYYRKSISDDELCADLRRRYPRPAGNAGRARHVLGQYQMLVRAMKHNDATDQEVFATCEAWSGTPRRPGTPRPEGDDWDAWLHMTRPSTWGLTRLSAAVEAEVASMLGDLRAWRAWAGILPELVVDLGIGRELAAAPAIALADRLATEASPSLRRSWARIRSRVVALVVAGDVRSPRRRRSGSGPEKPDCASARTGGILFGR